jgi:hypothetical protein
MKYSCGVVKDILPLYHDGVCSDDSRQLVEEHLAQCDCCQAVLMKIRDNTIDNQIRTERENVVERHTEAVKRRSFITGVSIAGVMAVPVIVCLIVNLATGHALDWFFIVLASLMVLASVTVVPLMMAERRGLWTLGSFTVSLLLLLFICSLYVGGSWFFVAATAVLFGLSIVFSPYVMYSLPLPGFAARHKGLLIMSTDTILLFAVIVVSGLYINGSVPDYWRPGILSALVSLLLPWGLFLIIRYMRANALVRAGISVIYSGLFVLALDNLLAWAISGVLTIQYRSFNLFNWSQATLEPNVFILTLLSCVVIGAVLLLLGFLRKKR